MLYEVRGDLVKDTVFRIFCHQVNCRGKMGKGIALQIKEAYPEVYEKYRADYEKGNFGLGMNLYVRTHDGRTCVNMYAQYDYGKGPHTDYGGLAMCLESLKKKLLISDEKLAVGFPYMMGCGNGGGDWEIVRPEIEKLADAVKQSVYIVRKD